METIEVVLVFDDGSPVDIIDRDFWEENQDDTPFHWDETKVITVPLKDWEKGNICFHNYKKYMV